MRIVLWQVINAVKRTFGLKLGHFIALGSLAVACALALVATLVSRQVGPTAGILLAATLALAGYRRLLGYAGFGTPPIREQLLHPALFAAGKAVRVVCMSDTHNRVLTEAEARLVPDADIFVHCGDVSVSGTTAEIAAFNQWLGLLPHRVKVVVLGNHDNVADRAGYAAGVALMCERDRREHEHDVARVAAMAPDEHRRYVRDVLLSNATHYLEGETITVQVPTRGGGAHARVTICGCPCTNIVPDSAACAFSMDDQGQLAMFNRALPRKPSDGVDVLVTHGPPFGVLDRVFFGARVGSLALSKTLVRLAREHRPPFAHLFGHLHETRGVVRGAAASTLLGERQQQEAHLSTTFVNCASVNMKYDLRPGSSGMCVLLDIPVDSLYAHRGADAPSTRRR